MRLDDARLCLDCEEIHEEQECPACGSEAYGFLTRWIKKAYGEGPRRRELPTPSSVTSRPAPTSEQLEAWRQIVSGTPAPRHGRIVTRGLLGLAAMGLAGWAWSRTGRNRQDRS
jgi:hypothetical protein